jgi:DNA-binding transcriptional LysR family regulator
MDLNTTQVEYFLTVAKYLNFSEAARQLFVTQSALSKQIAAFENELGFEIFHRTKRSVLLTPAGAILCKDLKELQQSFKHTLDKARQANLGLSGDLHICILDGLTVPQMFLSILSKFEARFPNINLNMSRYSFSKLRDNLNTGSIDLAITLSFEVSDRPEWISSPIVREDDVLAFSRLHHLSKRKNLSFEDVANEFFIVISPAESQNAMNHSLDYCRFQGITLKNIKYCDSLENMMLMLEAGKGVGVVSNHIRFYKNMSIQIVDLYSSNNLMPPKVDIVAVWKKTNYNPTISQFITLLESQ